MAIVKRLNVMSVAKVNALMGMFLGLIAGLVSSFMFAIIGGISSISTIDGGAAPNLGFGAALGYLSILVFPIIYAIVGFIGGIIFAAIYNLVAKWVGGIEVDLE